MSDKNRDFFEQLDQWDAEAALNERAEARRSAEEFLTRKQRPEEKKTSTTRQRPVGNAQRAVRKKRKKSNIKGWLILIGIVLALLLILVGIITLIVGWLTPEDDPVTTQTTLATEPTETTQSREEIIEAVIERAERLAAGYDYDAAVAALQEYGDDWALQTELKAAENRFLTEKESLVLWADNNKIPHISFRALIVDTNRAFDGDENSSAYNQNMVTVDEFRAILEELYDRGFVLVNLHDLVQDTATEKGTTDFEQGEIYLPEGKRPIVISQEDVNYYSYRVDGPDEDELPDAQGDGFACQLLLDENGEPTCKYIDADGAAHYGAYDFVPIVEEFVAQHPDFSYRGAKGMLAVTGSEGVFGFQTHPDWEDILGEDAYMEQIRQAQAVATALKERGWEIASQSYSRISYQDSDADTIAANLKKWDNQVAPIVGKTDILVFPYGADIGSVNYYSGEKFNVVYSAGYRIFCNMDAAEYWVQLRSNYLRQSRRVIDGYRLEHGAERLRDLFDAEKIIDQARPRPVPTIN